MKKNNLKFKIFKKFQYLIFFLSFFQNFKNFKIFIRYQNFDLGLLFGIIKQLLPSMDCTHQNC